MTDARKKQHYVSQFHLGKFVNEAGHVFAFDKVTQRVFPAAIKDIAHENHFLSVPELDANSPRGSFFEEHFGRIETPAAAAIADVLSRLELGMTQVITPESRGWIALLLAIQHLRTREARQRMVQGLDAMEQSLRDIRPEGTEEFKKWVDEVLSLRLPEKEEHARFLLNEDLFLQLASVISSHVWLVYAAPPDQPLYCSDHPLTLTWHEPRPFMGVGPATFAVELQFPLTPRYLLCMAERRWLTTRLPQMSALDWSLAGSLQPEGVTFQRSLQVRDSNRYVYCSRDDFDLAREMCASHPELTRPDRKRVEVNAPRRAG